MILRRLPALWALLVALTLAVPLAPAWAICDREEAEACTDNACDPSDCAGNTDAGGCAQCGQFGKMLAAKACTCPCLRPAVSLNLQSVAEFPPEGVAPPIDQPPRTA